ncbi:MAG: hypothetical protein CM1200mP39_15070 [Dehalococcoidia bacterium]|nr:MAG: hypothetical protein CM1200mP39_15070 [Dehalococcoidia bacterium]
MQLGAGTWALRKWFLHLRFDRIRCVYELVDRAFAWLARYALAYLPQSSAKAKRYLAAKLTPWPVRQQIGQFGNSLLKQPVLYGRFGDYGGLIVIEFRLRSASKDVWRSPVAGSH